MKKKCGQASEFLSERVLAVHTVGKALRAARSRAMGVAGSEMHSRPRASAARLLRARNASRRAGTEVTARRETNGEDTPRQAGNECVARGKGSPSSSPLVSSPVEMIDVVVTTIPSDGLTEVECRWQPTR